MQIGMSLGCGLMGGGGLFVFRLWSVVWPLAGG